MYRTDSYLGGVSLELYLGVGISSIVLSACFVAIRLSNTWRQDKKFLIEEYISIVAIVLSILAFTVRIYIARTAKENLTKITSPESENKYLSFLLTMEMSETIVSAFLAFFAKVPLFMLYIRLFGSIKSVRMVCYYSIAITLLQFIASSSLVGVFCGPAKNKPISPFDVDRCRTWNSYVVLWNGVIALATNIILFVIPFPIITRLNLQRRKKINLAIVFMAGIFGIAIGIISLYWRAISLKRVIPVSTLTVSMISECSVAIMISCVPAIPPFWANHFSKMTLHLRIRSAVSNLLLHKRETPMSSYETLQENMSNEENNSHRLTRLNDESASKKPQDMEHESARSWLAI
ncbi:hypothetical protein F4811DRAFT_521262 [Daldinia bambusicola]|nr:hypothetical protein F4811DRAFT_521262 [Daldinia bambusicola]